MKATIKAIITYLIHEYKLYRQFKALTPHQRRKLAQQPQSLPKPVKSEFHLTNNGPWGIPTLVWEAV